jgi:hypothetical protein
MSTSKIWVQSHGPVIPVIREANIGRIKNQADLGKNEKPYLKKQKGLGAWLKW